MPLISVCVSLLVPPQATGYFDTLKGQFGPGSILFAPNPSSEAAEEQVRELLCVWT